MNFDKRALVGFITEIEASRERAKGETRHQSEIFKKAREKGFEPKAMRQVLQRRAMKSADRERMDELLDLYEHAMGALAQAVEAVEGGMSAREAAERFGVPRGSLGAVVSGAKNAISEPVDHDAETGEIIETKPEDGDDGITESCGGVDGHAQSAGNVVSRDEPTPPSTTGEPCRHVGAGVEPGPHDTSRIPCATTWGRITTAREAHEAAVEAAREAKREARRQENARASALARITDDDMPEPLPFLRRTSRPGDRRGA